MNSGRIDEENLSSLGKFYLLYKLLIVLVVILK